MISINGCSMNIDHTYPDGTFSIRLSDEMLASVKHHGAVIDWRYAGEHELPAIIYLARHLYDIGTHPINLKLYYIPNARLDRINQRGEVFTLKYFAEVINSLCFDVVDVLDPHSSVSCALIDRLNIIQPTCWILDAIDRVSDAEGTRPLMFYPDEGAMKRYSGLVKAPCAFGIKKRDWESGKITMLEIHGESPIGKNVLMVDDICSRGGTFYHSARALKENGAANVYIYVTHCERTIFDGELLKGDLIRHIFTTDSVFTGQDEKITVFRI